jgi:hypothetical protein
MSSQIENTIEPLINAVSEDLLLKTLEKEIVKQDNFFLKLPKTFKKENTFYLSIFYQGSRIRSRTISNCPNDNNKFSKVVSLRHQRICDFYLSSMNTKVVEIQTGYISNKKPYMLIRIGNMMFIVSNSNEVLVEIFSFILATFFASLKALSEISESGHFFDLDEESKKYPYGANYLIRVKDMTNGKNRGHM